MKIAILGASGRTGGHILSLALSSGHDVVAMARNPAKLGAARPGLRVVRLDLFSPEAESALRAGLEGVEAVISALGPDAAGQPPVMARAAESLVAAARATGLRRLVWMTGAGVKLSGDAPSATRAVVRGIMRMVAGTVLEDSERAARAIAASDLAWTIVRAPLLSDGPGEGRLIASDRPPRPAALSRAEIAAFMLDCVLEGRFVGAAPFLSLGAARPYGGVER